MFRALASDGAYLRAACAGIPTIEEMRADDVSALAPGGQGLTFNVNNVLPAIASLDGESLPDDLQKAITELAAARLGSLVKGLGMCEKTGLHPFSVDPGLSLIMDDLQERASGRLAADLASTDDRDTVRRAKRVERIIFDQYLPDAALESMSFSDVMRSRTGAWGRAAEKRATFFAAIRKLADETDTDEEFDRAALAEIASYLKAQQALDDEWKKLGLTVGGPIVAGVLGDGSHLLEHLFGLASWEAVLAIVSAVIVMGSRAPAVQIWRQERSLKVSAGKALMSPYHGLVRA